MSVYADTPSGDNLQGSLLNNQQIRAELIPVFHNYYSADGVYRMYCIQDFVQYFPR